MKTVLTIQSQVAGALVGNSVAGFALQRLGVRALQAPTTLYGRRPDRGPPGGAPVAAATLRGMIEALFADGWAPHIDAVLSGYLAAPDQADVVAEAVAHVRQANPDAIYVCDPVVGDVGTGLFVPPAVAEAISARLIPLADMLTPNAWELGFLTAASVGHIADCRSAAKTFGKTTIVTSAPAPGATGALLCAAEGDWLAETALLPNVAKGAGDLFAAILLARLLSGADLPASLQHATGAVYDVLSQSRDLNGDLALIDAQDRLPAPATRALLRRLGDS